MLWALLRLSVRDARSQLRYGRFGGPGPYLARRRPRRPGRPGRGSARSFRSSLTRSDRAGTGSRARPESESDLPMFQDRMSAIPSTYIQEHAPLPLLATQQARLPRREEDERPGEDPGPFG